MSDSEHQVDQLGRGLFGRNEPGALIDYGINRFKLSMAFVM